MTTTGSPYCFFPNGDLVSSDTPCFPDEEISPCCGLVNGWTCLTNGICYHAETKMLGRGSCTDSKWGSSNCPQYCTESTYEFALISPPPLFFGPNSGMIADIFCFPDAQTNTKAKVELNSITMAWRYGSARINWQQKED